MLSIWGIEGNAYVNVTDISWLVEVVDTKVKVPKIRKKVLDSINWCLYMVIGYHVWLSEWVIKSEIINRMTMNFAVGEGILEVELMIISTLYCLFWWIGTYLLRNWMKVGSIR